MTVLVCWCVCEIHPDLVLRHTPAPGTQCHFSIRPPLCPTLCVCAVRWKHLAQVAFVLTGQHDLLRR